MHEGESAGATAVELTSSVYIIEEASLEKGAMLTRGIVVGIPLHVSTSPQTRQQSAAFFAGTAAMMQSGRIRKCIPGSMAHRVDCDAVPAAATNSATAGVIATTTNATTMKAGADDGRYEEWDPMVGQLVTDRTRAL